MLGLIPLQDDARHGAEVQLGCIEIKLCPSEWHPRHKPHPQLWLQASCKPQSGEGCGFRGHQHLRRDHTGRGAGLEEWEAGKQHGWERRQQGSGTAFSSDQSKYQAQDHLAACLQLTVLHWSLPPVAKHCTPAHGVHKEGLCSVQRGSSAPPPRHKQLQSLSAR